MKLQLPSIAMILAAAASFPVQAAMQPAEAGASRTVRVALAFPEEAKTR